MNEKAIWEPSQCAATQLEREEVILHLLFPNQPTLILFLSRHAKDPSFLFCPFLGPTTWQNRPGIYATLQKRPEQQVLPTESAHFSCIGSSFLLALPGYCV